MNKKVIAIIPARAGSKGIANKNTSLLDGKPLISYSVELTRNCALLNDVIVTSDDKKVLEISKKILESVILVNRPNELASDDALLTDVVKHAIDSYLSEGNEKPDTILLLQPTSPFREPKDIESALEQFHNSDFKSLISVSPPIQHPSDFIFNKDGSWYSCFDNDHRKEGRQNFTEAWFINGAIYIVDFKYFFQNQQFYSLDSCEIFKMSIENSIDIDLPIDLMMANAWINER